MADTPVSVHLVGGHYAPRLRRERIIASIRVALAAVSLLAVWLDPSLPSPLYEHETTFVLLAFATSALAVALVVWLAPVPFTRLAFVTHALDILLFALLIGVTEGPTSLFFIYFVFFTVAATLRWQWRGTVWTAMAALVAFNGVGVYGDLVLHDPAFELNRFLVRSVYLAAAAVLLGCVGAYEERRRREMSELGAWPHTLPRGTDLPLREMLRGAARILRAPRALLVWEEADEPWLHIASWSRGKVETWREPPDTFDPPVAEPMARLTFLSPDVRVSVPFVLHRSPEEPRERRGAPIHTALCERFAMTAVLSLPLYGPCFSGHLFALDNPHMTADDLLRGEILANQVAAAMDQSLLSRRLRLAAAAEERVRLSRDLHDGVLQSLTGAALQIETVQRLWDAEPRAARDRLAAIQRLVAEEQRDLRIFIRDSKLPVLGLADGDLGLDACLRELVRRVENLWGLQVELQVESLDLHTPDRLVYDLCHIVQETLVNAARHAAASRVCVTVGAVNGEVRVAVSDNGHGFPFLGEYDHAALTARQLGPVMLKERVESLRGTLAIRSTPAGSHLDIRLPRQRGST